MCCRASPIQIRIVLGTRAIPNLNIGLRLNDRPMIRSKGRHFPGVEHWSAQGQMASLTEYRFAVDSINFLTHWSSKYEINPPRNRDRNRRTVGPRIVRRRSGGRHDYLHRFGVE